MAKSIYPWKLMLMMYIKGNYTLSDLSHIFGAVEGHISKRFAEKGVTTRPRGKKSMQLSVKAFPSELNQEIKNVDKSGKLLVRIDKYYKNVCLPLKGAEILRLKEGGMSNAEIAERYSNLSESSVYRIVKSFKGQSAKSIHNKVQGVKAQYKNTKPTKKEQTQ